MATKVHCVSDIEELGAVERMHIAPVPRRLVAWVRLRTAIANVAVHLIRFAWFRKPRPLEGLQQIVVYAFGTLGDHLVTFPALAALRRACPSGRITLLSSTGGIGPQVLDELLGDHRLVDEIVCVPDPPTRRKGFRVEYDRALGALRGCDLFVNLSPFGNRGLANAVFRELFIARHLHARSAIGFRIRGWAGAKNLKRVLHLFVGNEPRRCVEVLTGLGLKPILPVEAIPRFPSARDDVLRKLSVLDGNAPLVVINPGSKFQVKCWPTERFSFVAQELKRKFGARIVTVGTAPEVTTCDAVLANATGANLAGLTTLPELAELLRAAALCITNDTGTMHLAAMVGCPTLALFATRLGPRQWFPLGEKVMALMAFEESTYDFRDEGDAHESLLAIGCEEVERVAASLLSTSAPSGDDKPAKELLCT